MAEVTVSPAPPDASAHGIRKASRWERFLASGSLAGWGFASPAMLLIAVFGIVPIVWSAVLSFQRNNLLTPGVWIGFKNYERLMRDPLFAHSVRLTVLYTLLFVPISIVLSLLCAVALNRKLWFIRLYRTAIFLPVVASTVAEAILFLWLFDPYYGVVNVVLSKLGIPQQSFFQNPSQALYCIVVMTVWGWLGFSVIIYLAALQGIPKELVEAAAIDGASRWRIFRRVELPLLGPTTLFLVVYLSINALQLFDEIYVTTRGGPLASTLVVVFYLYQQAFQFFDAGYATAIAYVLFLGILVLTIVQLLIGRRFVHYRS